MSHVINKKIIKFTEWNNFNLNSSNNQQNDGVCKTPALRNVNCLQFSNMSYGVPNKINYQVSKNTSIFGCPTFMLRHKIAENNLEIKRLLWNLAVVCPDHRGPALTLENLVDKTYVGNSKYSNNIIKEILELLKITNVLKEKLKELEDKKKTNLPFFTFFENAQKSKTHEEPNLSLLNQQINLVKQIKEEIEKEIYLQRNFSKLKVLCEDLSPYDIKKVLKQVEGLLNHLVTTCQPMDMKTYSEMNTLLDFLKAHRLQREKQLQPQQQQQLKLFSLQNWEVKWEVVENKFKSWILSDSGYSNEQLTSVSFQNEILDSLITFLKDEIFIQNQYPKLPLLKKKLKKNFLLKKVEEYKKSLNLIRGLADSNKPPNYFPLSVSQFEEVLRIYLLMKNYNFYRQSQLKDYIDLEEPLIETPSTSSTYNTSYDFSPLNSEQRQEIIRQKQSQQQQQDDSSTESFFSTLEV